MQKMSGGVGIVNLGVGRVRDRTVYKTWINTAMVNWSQSFPLKATLRKT